MKEFVDFLSKYYSVIIAACCFVLQIIILIVKKRPKTLDNFLSILNEAATFVPGWISQVECPGNGDQKKSQVLLAANRYISKQLGRSLSNKEIEISNRFIDSLIEAVLSTPTKKEVLYEE